MAINIFIFGGRPRRRSAAGRIASAYLSPEPAPRGVLSWLKDSISSTACCWMPQELCTPFALVPAAVGLPGASHSPNWLWEGFGCQELCAPLPDHWEPILVSGASHSIAWPLEAIFRCEELCTPLAIVGSHFCLGGASRSIAGPLAAILLFGLHCLAIGRHFGTFRSFVLPGLRQDFIALCAHFLIVRLRLAAGLCAWAGNFCFCCLSGLGVLSL